MLLSGSKRLLLAVLSLVAVSLFNTKTSNNFLRRLTESGIKTVYASPESAKNIPPFPTATAEDIPAYLALCQEWIRHDAYDNVDGSYQSYTMVENIDVCMDWSAPHLGLMEMFAAMIVSAHVPHVRYRHNCNRTKIQHHYKGEVGFDYTTIQQVIGGTPGVASNTHIRSAEEIKQQCRRCLLSYNPEAEAGRVRAKGYHHCLAWPQDHAGVRKLDPDNLPFVLYNFTGVAPLSTNIVTFGNVSLRVSEGL